MIKFVHCSNLQIIFWLTVISMASSFKSTEVVTHYTQIFFKICIHLHTHHINTCIIFTVLFAPFFIRSVDTNRCINDACLFLLCMIIPYSMTIVLFLDPAVTLIKASNNSKRNGKFNFISFMMGSRSKLHKSDGVLVK